MYLIKKHFLVMLLSVIYIISISYGDNKKNSCIYYAKNKSDVGYLVVLDSILLYLKVNELSPDINRYDKYVLHSIVDNKAKYIEINKDTLCYGLLRDSLNPSTDSLEISFINVSRHIMNIRDTKPIYDNFTRFLYIRNDPIKQYYFRHNTSGILYFMLDNEDKSDTLNVYFDYDSQNQELSNKIQITNATTKNVQVFWYFFVHEQDYKKPVFGYLFAHKYDNNVPVDTLIVDFKRNEIIDNGDTLTIYNSL